MGRCGIGVTLRSSRWERLGRGLSVNPAVAERGSQRAILGRGAYQPIKTGTCKLTHLPFWVHAGMLSWTPV